MPSKNFRNKTRGSDCTFLCPPLKAGSVWIVIKRHKVQLNPGKEDGGVSGKDAIMGEGKVGGFENLGGS